MQQTPLSDAVIDTFDGVMSCSGRVVVVRADDHDTAVLARQAVDRLRHLERLWSRFIDTSEISRLNTADGNTVTVSGETVTLVEQLIEATALTGGAFDPTLLRPLVELGYDTSRSDGDHRTTLGRAVAVRGAIDEIDISPTRHEITLPLGTALDPGGLGKGLAADIVSHGLIAAGARGCLVEIGGDLRVRGEAPEGLAWTVAVDAPDQPPVLLSDGGVATSSSVRRTWLRDGRRHHHLIDPVSLRPTARGVVECTIAAGSAAIAEALTKVAFVNGLVDGVGFYADRGVAARIIDSDGSTVTTPGWRTLQGDRRRGDTTP
jgi:thiamine biosynthesis lipoprotein